MLEVTLGSIGAKQPINLKSACEKIAKNSSSVSSDMARGERAFEG
jgi:hypothetical protein